MSKSVVIYKKEEIPEKGLIKAIYYSYHPDSDTKERIIDDVKKNLKCELDDYVVGIDVTVSLKEYHIKPEDKKFWYDDKLKPNNDTKNTGV